MTLHIGSVGTPIRANTMEPEVFRQFVGLLLGGNIAGWPQGRAGPTDMAVVQHAAGANMSVDVSSGLVLVAGTQSAPTQGVYHGFNDATVNVTIAASNPTYPRIDLVCVSIQDAYYSGATSTGVIQAVTGTPAVSPAVPTAPANTVVLAHVYVGANVSSITNSNINGTAGSGNPDTVAYMAPIVNGGIIAKGPPTFTPAFAGSSMFDKYYGVTWWYDGSAWHANGPGLVMAKIYRTAALTLTTAADQIVLYDTIDYDPCSRITLSTSAMFTCPFAGKFRVTGQLTSNGPGTNYQIKVYKNGTWVVVGTAGKPDNAEVDYVSGVINCAASDYLQIDIYPNASYTVTTGELYTWASFEFLGS